MKAQEHVDQLPTNCKQLMIQKLPGGKKHELRTEAGGGAAGVLEIGMEVGMQKMADFFAIALNDPAVLGKSILGKKRLMPVLQRVHDLIDEFAEAFTVADEADYMQEKLDRILRKIYGGSEFVPFEERYPAIKQRKYK